MLRVFTFATMFALCLVNISFAQLMNAIDGFGPLPELRDSANRKWEESFFRPGLGDGSIQVNVIEQLESRVYVGGNFTTAGGDTVNSITVWDTLTEHWTPLGGGLLNFGVPGTVSAIHFTGLTTIVAGNFDEAVNPDGSSVPVTNIAEWDGSTWSDVNLEDIDGPIYSLAEKDFRLYAGGAFSSITTGGTTISTPAAVAIFDLFTGEWEPLPGRFVSGNPNFSPFVNVVKAANGLLYFGGQFTSVVNEDQVLNSHSVAAFDPQNELWINLDDGLGNGNSWRTDFTEVNDLLVDGKYIYACGNFTKTASQAANYIARWDTVQKVWEPLDGGVNEAVLSLTRFGADIVAVGLFDQVNGMEANYIARWNHALGWQQVTDLRGNIGLQDWAAAAGQIEEHKIAVGQVHEVHGIDAGGFTLYDGVRWTATAGGGIIRDGRECITAVAIKDSLVFAGGNFSYAGSKSAWNIAVWNRNTSTWSSLGLYGLNEAVTGMTIDGDRLYVTGRFTEAYDHDGAPVAADHIAVWDIPNRYWVNHGINTGIGNDSPPNTILVQNGVIYIGGAFTEIDGVEAWGVAKYDNGWEALDGPEPSINPGGPGLNGVVFDLAIMEGSLIAAGGFHIADDIVADYIARWDGTRWQPFGGVISGGPVFAIDVKGSELYAAGDFTAAYNPAEISLHGVARFSGGKWSSLGDGITSFDHGATSYVTARDIKVRGAEVFVAGDFLTAGTTTANSIARWDGTSWSSLGDGVTSRYLQHIYIGAFPHSLVNTIALTDSAVYLGGAFTQAGDVESSGLAIWDEAVRLFKLYVRVQSGAADSAGNTTTPPAGEYTVERGSTVQLSANSTSGWLFSGWDGTVSGSEASQSITVDRNINAIASFGRLQMQEAAFLHLSPDDGWTAPLMQDDYYATTDGNPFIIRAKVRNEARKPVPVSVSFSRNGIPLTAKNGQSSIDTILSDKAILNEIDFYLDTEDYAWKGNGTARQFAESIKTEFIYNGEAIDTLSQKLLVKPKPVIMVHGLLSNAATWDAYTDKQSNFLKNLHPHWRGSAVSTMKTGKKTLTSFFSGATIDDNAQKLSSWIEKVRAEEDAFYVDILAHSMGGLISRRYVHQYMQTSPEGKPVIEHLVMIGTPNEGSPCARTILLLSAAVQAGRYFALLGGGFNKPNNFIELTPTYVRLTFNEKVFQTKQVDYSILAGEIFPNTCVTARPGDGVVALGSAVAANTPELNNYFTKIDTAKLLHTAMTKSPTAFETFVRPILLDLDDRGSRIREKNSKPVTPLAADNDELPSTAGFNLALLAPGETYEASYPLSGFSQVGASITTVPSVTSGLISPSGETAASTQANSDEAQNPFRSYLITSDEEGEWKIKFTNTANDSTFAAYSINLTGAAVILAQETPAPNEDNTIPITAALQNNGSPITGAEVHAIVSDFNAYRDSLRLFDDGEHGDSAAGDGIYGGITEVLADGFYTITTTALYDGGIRYAMQLLQLGEEDAADAPDISIAAVAPADSIGVGEELTIELSIENFGAVAAGQVTVTAHLPAAFDVTDTFTDTGDISESISNGLTGNLGTLAPGQQASIRITGSFTDNGLYEFSFITVTTTEETSLGDNTDALQIQAGTIPTGINEAAVVEDYRLYEAYPNPFNPEATITFDLPEQGMARLAVYNVLGEEVEVLVNRELSSGRHTVQFNGRNLSSGIYIYRLTATGFTRSRKMMLLK